WTSQVGEAPEAPLEPGESDLVARRPRGIGAIIGSTVRLYARYPLLFPVLAAVVLVPYALVVLAAPGRHPGYASHVGGTAEVVLATLPFILINPLVSALHVHAVSDVREGRVPRIGDVAMRGLRVLPVVVAAAIMSTLGIALGLVALIVPGVILWF